MAGNLLAMADNLAGMAPSSDTIMANLQAMNELTAKVADPLAIRNLSTMATYPTAMVANICAINANKGGDGHPKPDGGQPNRDGGQPNRDEGPYNSPPGRDGGKPDRGDG